MAMSHGNPFQAPIGLDFAVVSVSVSTSVSAMAAGVGPFRGLFAITSCSFTVTGLNNNSMAIDNMAKNSTIWIQGAFISVIATATSLFILK